MTQCHTSVYRSTARKLGCDDELCMHKHHNNIVTMVRYQLTIRTELDKAEGAAAVIYRQRLEAVSIVSIPESDQAIKAAAGHHCAIIVEVHARDRV